MLKVFTSFFCLFVSVLAIGQSMWGVSSEKFRIYQHFVQGYHAKLSVREKGSTWKSVTMEVEEGHPRDLLSSVHAGTRRGKSSLNSDSVFHPFY